jgi:hypothetical protein
MKSINNIDDFLKDSLTDYSAPTSEYVKLQMAKKIKRFNFLKFNLGSFNIFYLGAVVIISTGILSFTPGIFNDSSDVTKAKIIDEQELNTNLPNSETKTIDPNETQQPNTNNNYLILKNTTDNTHKESDNVSNNDNTYVSEKTDPFISETNDDIAPEDKNLITEITDSIKIDSISEPTTIVYDTVINKNQINVVDTVITNVHQTVKIKKPKKRNK